MDANQNIIHSIIIKIIHIIIIHYIDSLFVINI